MVGRSDRLVAYAVLVLLIWSYTYMGLLGWVILILLPKSLGLVGFNRICHVLGSDIIFVINSSDEHC